MVGACRTFLAAAAVFVILCSASSDGSTAAPPTTSWISTPPETSRSQARSLAVSQPRHAAQLRGCFPKELAYQLVMQCRDPPKTVPIANSECCGVALSAIARPACFCQVRKEPAFGMSAVYNRSNLKTLVSSCGGVPLLIRLIDEPCGDVSHTLDDYGCDVPAKAAASSAGCRPTRLPPSWGGLSWVCLPQRSSTCGSGDQPVTTFARLSWGLMRVILLMRDAYATS